MISINVTSFEQVSFNHRKSITTLLENLSDADFNVFNENLQNLNTEYFETEDCYRYLRKINQKSISILHVNRRSINKNFEKVKLMFSEISFKFIILVFKGAMHRHYLHTLPDGLMYPLVQDCVTGFDNYVSIELGLTDQISYSYIIARLC